MPVVETIAMTVASVVAKQAATVVVTKAWAKLFSDKKKERTEGDDKEPVTTDDLLVQMDRILVHSNV